MDTRDLKERLGQFREWSKAIDELEQDANQLSDVAVRAARLVEIAQLSEEVIANRGRAVDIYLRAWELDQSNIVALSRARELCRELGRLQKVVELGTRELEVRNGQDAGHLAGIIGEAMLDTCDREAALPLLKQALSSSSAPSRIKDAIAAAGYDDEFWEDTVERLCEESKGADSTTAARMLLRAARILHMEAPQDERYEALLRNVLEYDAQNESANALFESLLIKSKRVEELDSHYERRAYAAPDENTQAKLYRRFGLDWIQHFQDQERAARYFAKAIEAGGDNGVVEIPSLIAAFSTIASVYGANQKWDDVLRIADQCIGKIPEYQRLHVAMECAVVAWKQLDDRERASAYFEIVRGLEPKVPLLVEFDANVAKREADVLEGQDAPDTDTNTGNHPILFEDGETLEPPSPELQAAMDEAKSKEGKGVDKAIEAWRKVIASEPTERAPRRELVRVLREAERWNALAEALKDELNKATISESGQVHVLRELVEVYRKGRNETQVIATLQQIVKLSPEQVDVYDELATAYEAKNRWPDLVKTLTKKAEHLDDETAQVQLYLRIAELYVERFSNQAEAIRAYERVLSLAPDNKKAVTHLLAVYERRRDWEKLIQLREREIDGLEGDERIEKTLEVAQLAATKVKKPAVCITWWEKVLSSDPGHEQAIGELFKLYERAKSWDKLAEVCNKKANIAADTKSQIDALQKLGLLYSDKLDNKEKAVEAWQRLLAVDPTHRRAQDALRKLYIAAGAWDELEEFYRKQEKIDEFVRVLERQVDGAAAEHKLGLALKIAVMYRDEVQKPDRAMRAFERVLSIDENNLEAAEALIPLYEKGRDPRKLVKALTTQLEQTKDPQLRQERIRRIAEYSEEKLRDKHAAFGWWLQAHAEQGTSEIRVELERLAQETESWAELVEAYKVACAEPSAGGTSDDPSQTLAIMSVIARVQERELGEIDQALETNRSILELDDSDPDALAALERLYVSLERYEELLDIYKRKLDLTTDPDQRTEIRFKIGQLYEEEVEDDAKAISTYCGILDDSGEDVGVLRALDRLYTKGERWRDLADTLERQICLVDVEEDGYDYVSLMNRLGQTREQHLEDVGGAIEAYQSVLDLDSNNTYARDALEKRLRDKKYAFETANTLEPIYEELALWPQLVEVYEIQLAEEQDNLRRVGLLMRIGELYAQRIGNPDRAFDAYARCFQVDPGVEGAKNHLEELGALVDGGFERLVNLFEGAIKSSDIDPSLAHELSIKVATAYEEQLEDSDKAVEFYREALRLEPDDLSALYSLEQIFTRDEKYADLLEIYRRKADISTNPTARIAILTRTAAIHEEMLGQTEEAIALYSEVLSHDGENRNALRALDRLYAGAERWEELSDNLVRELALFETMEEQVPLLLRLATLRENQLMEISPAIETYQQVLEHEPDHAEAVSALERLIVNEDHELSIAQILEPIYRASGAWNKQVRVYEIMARNAYDPERKIELYHQIAELYELGGDDSDAAFEMYARALREDPGSEQTQAQLERITRMLGKWDGLVSLYDSVIEDISSDELKIQLLTKLATIYEVELEKADQAVTTYEKILQVSPTYVDAASAIQLLHEREGNYVELVTILKRKSEMIFDLPERKALLFKTAQIQEEVLDDPNAAIDSFRTVLDIDDMDEAAVSALERLYIQQEQWLPLKDIYSKKADLTEDPEKKKEMWFVLGGIYERELGDSAQAIETYQAILDIEPDEIKAIQALDRLFVQAERWYDLLQNLEQQVELTESDGDCLELKFRIGKLWEGNLGDLSRATESYREVLQINPAHAPTLDALDALMRKEQGEPVLAAQALEPIYEGIGEYEKLIDVLEVVVAHGDDPENHVSLLHRIGQLYEHQLEHPSNAFDAYARALGEDSGNRATLGHLERLAAVVNVWPRLSELYEAEADKSLDVPRQVDLLTRLARIYEDELDSEEQAIKTLVRILDVEFDNADAVAGLDRLYTSSGRWQELTDVLRKEVQLANTDDDIVRLQFRLAQVLEQNLNDRAAAIEQYREILAATPEHTPTISALELMFLEGESQIEIAAILEPLYEASNDFDKLLRIYEVQLEKLNDPTDRQSMFQRIAEIAEGQLGDPMAAFGWWGRAIVEDPQSTLAHEECERLARAVGAWDALAEVYSQVLTQHKDSEVQTQTLLWLARIHEVELADSARAVGSYLRVLEMDDQQTEALAALDRLYVAAGFHDELVDILRRRIDCTLDGDEIMELQFRRGSIYSDSLNDPDSALACYEAILDQESRNRRALEAQERIYFRREQWGKLYETYEKLIDVADGDDELAEMYMRMARVASDALDKDEDAIDFWNRVLDIRGEDQTALEAIAELYERREMWEELVETIERQVSVVQDTRAQISLYKSLGKVWSERLHRERNALDAWLCADELDPSDLETIRALASLYKSTQSWEELSQALQRMIQVGQVTREIGHQDIIELHAQLGELEGDILGRIDNAVEAWRRVLALDSSDFRGLNALEQLFTREARWEECIEVLEKRAVAQEGATRIDTLLQAGAVWEERVEDLDRAAQVYERVRGEDPTNRTASERLEDIYRAQHRWELLNDILLERVDNSEEPSERIDILGRVAQVFEQELQDAERAFVVLQAAFQIDYSHEKTASELERLATTAGKWEELLADYTGVVQGLEETRPDAACDLWVKIGRWYGDNLSHVDYAIHSIQQALRIDSGHLGALTALADFQRKRGSWPELVETLAKHAKLEIDYTRKVDIYLSLAELLETHLQDTGEAINAYQAALEVDPDCVDALSSLERLYRSHEMWQPLIDTLRQRAALSTEIDDIVRAKLEVGDLLANQLRHASAAVDAYQDVVDTDPSNLTALRALEQLYEDSGQSEKYLEILEAQLDASPTDAERISLYERMASAWQERFGKLDRAAECLEKVITLDERNYQAYDKLSRLYRQDEKWDSLIDTYRNHILAAVDNDTRIDIYCAMGSVYEKNLKDVDRAIEAYTDALTFDDNESRALDALGRLYESISEWERAIDVMQQLLGTTEQSEKQVDLCHRIGRIHIQLSDLDQAEKNFLRGLSIDATHVASMEQLVELYSSRGDWLKAAQMMITAEANTPNVLDKVRLLFDAARIHLDRLDDPEQGKQYLAAAIALDPEHVEAATPLAELYLKDKQWAELQPILEMLVRKARQQHNRDPEQMNELYYRTARCLDELEENDKALEFYKSAYEIDPTYLPTLVGRGNLLYKMQDWDGAGRIYQTILMQHRDSQDESEVVEIYYRLGMVRLHLNERKKALNMFEKALEADSGHADTLHAVIGIREAQGDFEAVVHAKRGLMLSGDDARKVELLSEIGDMYREKLNNPQKAIVAYTEGLELSPDNTSLLQRALDLFTVTEQWKKAVETIERFTQLEKDSIRRGSYYQAAGTVCRDKIKAHDQALEYYERALDCFFEDEERLPKSMLPRALKSFIAIDKILTAKRDWKSQERAYRRMIRRVSEKNPIIVDLLHSLGEIYRSRLKHYKSAIQAFELAQKLDPSKPERGEILAELYVLAGSDFADKAIEQHMAMLRNDPFKYDSYKALRSIYMDTKQYDKTWCVCNALAFLKKADASEMQFYDQYRPRGFVKAKNRITGDVWRKIYHPDENRYIGAILQAIWQGAASRKGGTHKQFGLKRKERLQLESDQLLFSKVFYYVAQVIDLPVPDVYLRDDQPDEMMLANCLEKGVLYPSILVRKDTLRNRTEQEVAFVSARMLSFMRPDHYLKLALQTKTELKTALLSAIVLVKPDFPVPPEMQMYVQQYLPEMQSRISPQAMEQLSAMVNRFLKAAPRVDMATWGHAVEATGHRVGFILSGDLETSARLVSAEPPELGGPQPKDKIKELVLYSVSEDYFAVREHLKLVIG